MFAAPLLASFASLPTLGYRPFLDPLPLETYWLLLMPPMAIAIALVYKTIKLDSLEQLPRQAALLAVQIVAFMAMAAVGLWLITEIF
ncbi:MAG: hypothetical protein NTW19_19500 [Planctomycetota bacterium]|nr:hypothetical protein [Planctomycetota bacterium]